MPGQLWTTLTDESLSVDTGARWRSQAVCHGAAKPHSAFSLAANKSMAPMDIRDHPADSLGKSFCVGFTRPHRPISSRDSLADPASPGGDLRPRACGALVASVDGEPAKPRLGQAGQRQQERCGMSVPGPRWSLAFGSRSHCGAELPSATAPATLSSTRRF